VLHLLKRSAGVVVVVFVAQHTVNAFMYKPAMIILILHTHGLLQQGFFMSL
jgi:hypothetical protein